jgi:uncharacterized protein (TIGR00251 family)
MADLHVRLTPRAHRDAITKVDGGVVHARVTAPPVDGRANAALTRLIADALGVPRSRVELVKGHAARIKVLRVDGLPDDEALRRIAPDLGATSTGG